MTRPNRPTFLLTKGERAKADGQLYTGDIIEHYRSVAAGKYAWDGLPEGCPRTFIEDSALFFSPGVAAKKVRGYGPVICPIRPSTLDFYGRPYTWMPEPFRGMRPIAADADYFSESGEPALWTGISAADAIEPYLDVMQRCLSVLNTNVFALSQPIMITGVSGASLGSMVMKSELIDGAVYIPTTGAGATPPEVLDLGAEDHTQNLISTIDWCDARILEVMASSNGVEKSSGVSAVETVSGVQSVMQQFEAGLELRREWCDRINDRLKLSISVRPGKGVQSLSGTAPGSDDAEPEDGGDGDGQRLPVWGIPVPQDGGCGGAHRENGGDPQQDIVPGRVHRGHRIRRVRDSDSVTCRCIEADTPQSIMDDGSIDGEYAAGTDIFEEIADTAAGEFTAEALMVAMLWHRYRFEGIGSCDPKRWVQVMADRLDTIGPKWETMLTALEDLDLADLAELAYTRRVDRTAIPGTEGSVRTVGHSGSDETVTGSETLPQSPVDGRSYLDSRTTAKRTNGQTDTEKYAPNERDEETYKEYRDIEAATFARLLDEYPDIPGRFADEFSDLFLGRWRCRHTRRQGSTSCLTAHWPRGCTRCSPAGAQTSAAIWRRPSIT